MRHFSRGLDRAMPRASDSPSFQSGVAKAQPTGGIGGNAHDAGGSKGGGSTLRRGFKGGRSTHWRGGQGGICNAPFAKSKL